MAAGPRLPLAARRWAQGQVSRLAIGEPQAACSGKTGHPAHYPEVRIKGSNLGFCQGLAGLSGWGASWERKLWGCRGCGKSFEGRRPGMGAPGAGRRPLELGWAGDERGMPPPRPEAGCPGGNQSPGLALSCMSPSLSDLWQPPPPTLLHSLSLSSTGFIPREKVVHIIQSTRGYGSATPFQYSPQPLPHKEPP